MSKYYRVRTKVQWDWLMKWFEKQGIKWRSGCSPTQYTQTIIRSILVEFYNGELTMQLDCGENAVEVSQMMEDEKMEDYLEIKGEDLEKLHWETNYGRTSFINYDKNGEKYAHEQFLPANLSIPKSLVQQKVKIEFTKAEKAEFDSIDNDETLYNALDIIEREDYPHLYKRIYEHAIMSIPKFELEFTRAWADPSLIEVLPEKKWHVRAPKVMDTIYIKNDDGSLKTWKKTNAKISDTFPIEEWYKTQFTTEELKHYGLDNDLFEKVEVSE